MFSSTTYQRRREILKKEVSHGGILLLGHIESPINFEHNTYPFRQDSSFLYYVGIQAPRLAVLFDVDENRDILFGDEHDLDDVIWMGRQETLQDKCLKCFLSTHPNHIVQIMFI